MRNVTCQKLLYDDQAVVSAEPRTTLDIKIGKCKTFVCPSLKLKIILSFFIANVLNYLEVKTHLFFTYVCHFR